MSLQYTHRDVVPFQEDLHHGPDGEVQVFGVIVDQCHIDDVHPIEISPPVDRNHFHVTVF